MATPALATPNASSPARDIQLGRIRVTLTTGSSDSITGVIEEMSPTDVRIYSEETLPIGTLVSVRLAPVPPRARLPSGAKA